MLVAFDTELSVLPLTEETSSRTQVTLDRHVCVHTCTHSSIIWHPHAIPEPVAATVGLNEPENPEIDVRVIVGVHIEDGRDPETDRSLKTQTPTVSANIGKQF
jgi:hypothetical protein